VQIFKELSSEKHQGKRIKTQSTLHKNKLGGNFPIDGILQEDAHSYFVVFGNDKRLE
jgi:hypothetical protein